MAVLLGLVAAAAMLFPTLSDWYASNRQHDLAAGLDDPALAGQVASGSVADGKPIGRIIVPAMGLDMVMVQGVGTSALESGPGHYPGSPMPCTLGDAAIAGHRTTFLHPFYSLNTLKPGDLVEIKTAAWTCAYAVSSPPFSVLPSDSAVVSNTPGHYNLTLTTCTPIGSSSHRLVVKAAMIPGSLKPTPAAGARAVGSKTSTGAAQAKS